MLSMQKSTTPASFWSRWVYALIVMGLIFFFSSLPSKDIPSFGEFDFSIKKLAHMIGYACLAPAYLRGIGKKGAGETAISWVMAIMYAFTDETHQAFVAGRTSSIFDVGIDGIGALAGLLVTYVLTLRTLNRNPRRPLKP